MNWLQTEIIRFRTDRGADGLHFWGTEASISFSIFNTGLTMQANSFPAHWELSQCCWGPVQACSSLCFCLFFAVGGVAARGQPPTAQGPVIYVSLPGAGHGCPLPTSEPHPTAGRQWLLHHHHPTDRSVHCLIPSLSWTDPRQPFFFFFTGQPIPPFLFGTVFIVSTSWWIYLFPFTVSQLSSVLSALSKFSRQWTGKEFKYFCITAS